MKGTAFIIEPSGATHIMEYEGETPNLAFHNEAVGGFIEKVPGWDRMHNDDAKPCIAYCNEDGKTKGLAVNLKATTMWNIVLNKLGHTGPLNDVLVGNVLILTGDAAFMRAL